MILAATVLLACSFGPGKCGVSGDFMDLTRPQDLRAARAYINCLHTSAEPAVMGYRLRVRCTSRAHIRTFLSSDGYSGPLVEIDTGKAWHSSADQIVPSPTP